MNGTNRFDKIRSALASGLVAENALVFLAGAFIYYFAETVYRGYSHITMFFAGGICFLIIYIGEKCMAHTGLVVRGVVYAFMITAVEFVFGIVFNLIFNLGVWDYSKEPFNILGQVCPGFTVMWFALSFPAMWLCKGIRIWLVKTL